MIRGYWAAVTFAVGILVGVFFARPLAETATTAALPEQKSPAPVISTEPLPAPNTATAHANPFAAHDPKAAPAGKPAEPAPAIAPSTADITPEYSGYSEPIDVGPVFREQFAEAQKHGVKGSLLELHQNLEREVRNDAWAYAAESEIQNSLVADASIGNFKVDHLECRATSCEVRLSAQGKFQTETLSKWQQGMRSQQWGNGLEPRASSMIGQDDRADILVILVKPEKKAPEKLPKAS